MADATGLSLVYCNQVRRGQRVPHPRHWPALRTLASTAPRVEHTDPEYYRTEILPRLAAFTPAEIADATGMSVSYAKRVRRGTRMPGVRWWGALGRLWVEGRQSEPSST